MIPAPSPINYEKDVTSATNIGVFYDVPTGAVKYIMNPDFEQELDWQVMGPGEALVRIPKDKYRLRYTSNAMTLDQVNHVVSTFNPNNPNDTNIPS